MTNDAYTTVLLEDMNGKFDVLMEIVVGMRDELKKKADKSDVEELRGEAGAIKIALKHTNKDVSELKTDVRDLKEDVAELKTEMREVKHDLRSFDRRLIRPET